MRETRLRKKSNKGNEEEWESPREVPTRHYPGSYHDTAENGIMHLIDRSRHLPLWTVSRSVESAFDRSDRPVSQLFECGLDSDKPVVVFRRDILFAVAFDEDVLNKGSPVTEWRVCNNVRGVSTETCHSNEAGRPWSTYSKRCVV